MATGYRNYQHGNTARKLQHEERSELYALPVSSKMAYRREQKMIRANISYVCLFVTILIAMCFVIWHYINIQSELIVLRNTRAGLQSRYESLRLENDLYEDQIISAVNIQEIERIAVEELGMKLAGEGQIITYSGEIEDYVKQYMDFPE